MESEAQTESDAEYTRCLAKARAGETSALLWLIEAESRWLLSLAQRKALFRGNNVLPTDDLVQETLVRVLSSTRPPKAKSRSQFRSWLATIARNTTLDSLKRSQPATSIACQPEFEGAVQPALESSLCDERAEELELFRAGLSFREEAALMLRSYCQMKHARLALVLRCENTNSAQCLHTRALRKIQDSVARHGKNTA